MGFVNTIRAFFEKLFPRTSGAWGAAFVLDEEGNIIDDWDDE